MAAHCHDPPARTSDVSEQQLDYGSRANHLNPGRMLGPAERVDNRAGALAARVTRERFGDAAHLGGGASADLRDGLWGVAREMAAQNLKNASRMPQGRILLGLSLPTRNTVPPHSRFGVVTAGGWIKAGKETIAFISVGVALRDNRGGVGEAQHVFLKP